MKEDVLSYMVACGSDEEIVSEIFFSPENTGSVSWLVCLNPHSYATARSNDDFAKSLRAADWLIPDGIGIVMASKLMGGQIKKRLTGFDIFAETMKELDKIGGRVFFLGSTEKTLGLIRDRVARDYPNIILAGTCSPPFKPVFSKQDNDAMISVINQARPDVLWVGMTAPKQELWIYSHHDQLDVRFAGAIGAVFDFYTGQVKRSHPVFQRLGLEWLPRLVAQPRRLWRRMFVSAPIFLFDVFRSRFGLLSGGQQNKDKNSQKYVERK